MVQLVAVALAVSEEMVRVPAVTVTSSSLRTSCPPGLRLLRAPTCTRVSTKEMVAPLSWILSGDALTKVAEVMVAVVASRRPNLEVQGIRRGTGGGRSYALDGGAGGGVDAGCGVGGDGVGGDGGHLLAVVHVAGVSGLAEPGFLASLDVAA